MNLRKLNLGCGYDKREGFVNADNFPDCQPDVNLNIEQTPWQLENDSFDYVLMKHVLEHVGADFKTFKNVMSELYRITAHDGVIEIQVPHYKHETYWSDPTHVRAFTPLTFKMMSKRQNDLWIKSRANYTMLAYVLNVNFEVIQASYIYDRIWYEKVARGEITKDQLREMGNNQWGVIKELHIQIKAIKK